MQECSALEREEQHARYAEAYRMYISELSMWRAERDQRMREKRERFYFFGFSLFCFPDSLHDPKFHSTLVFLFLFYS